MALYVSVATRRRRAAFAVAVTGLLALGLGVLIGRQQVPSIDQRVADVRTAAADIATGIERLDIEYEQVLIGADTAEGGVIEPLDGLRTDLIQTMDDAPWLAPSTRSTLLDGLAAIDSAVTASAALDEVRAVLGSSAQQIRSAFAVT